MKYSEKKISSDIKFEGRIIKVRKDEVELINGERTMREVVEHPGGVAVVPIDSDGCVIAVRQFRYPYERELLEVPAGKLEEGEDPLDCAVRELSEETGFSAREIISLGYFYPSPGYCKEVLYIYLALGLTPGKQHLDENEFLDVERIPLEEFTERILSGEIHDAKTIIGILKAEKYLNK